MTKEQSILEKKIDPLWLAAIALGGVVVFTLLAKAIAATGLIEIPERFAWMSAASFMLLFAIFNSLLSISSPDMMKYWSRSVYSFMGLAAGAGLFAWAVSGTSIRDAGSYQWIYIVVSMGYLIFLSIMATLKRIVNFAQREEWNQPRKRR